MNPYLIREAIQPGLRISVLGNKEILWDKIEDILEIAGYSVAKIKQDLLYERESGIIIISISRK
jgi:hypothetical protein